VPMKSWGKLWLAAALFLVSTSYAQKAEKWELGPFTRPASGNPVIAPRPESTFIDPILKKPVHREALHTFNPAAIVRDGKVYVLYRAEDDSGAMEIGVHFAARPGREQRWYFLYATARSRVLSG
jgi:beta-1,2-mannosidase